MWARKRLDIGWTDLLFGAAHSMLPVDRGRQRRRVEGLWSASGDALACLSVRSGFDLLLDALDFPPGSEVLVSALTIPDMVRVITEHGLVGVPIDLDPATMSPNLESLRRSITPATKAVLVAHLFGGRTSLAPLLQVAARHRLAVIEDCAQAYSGPDYTGYPGVDAALFSFGPIKTATCLGGALVRVRDRQLLHRMRSRQAQYPVQSRWGYLARVAKYASLKTLSFRPVFALFVRACRLAGCDHDRLINGAVRGFAGNDFFRRIRRQPCGALLSLMARRLRRFDPVRLARRAAVGSRILARLDDARSCPGSAAAPHSHWVFPVLADDPPGLIAALAAAGFDATQGQSLAVVEPPPDRPGLAPRATREMTARLVYAPCYPELPLEALVRMTRVLRERGIRSGPIAEPEPVIPDLSSAPLEISTFCRQGS